MDSVGVTLPDGTEQSFFDGPGFPVFLDSGGTLSRLPTPLYNAIGSSFPGVQFDAGSGFYVVDCSLSESDGSVDFGFGNKIIRVAYKDFIWHIPDSEFCVVGLLPEDGEFCLTLGSWKAGD